MIYLIPHISKERSPGSLLIIGDRMASAKGPLFRVCQLFPLSLFLRRVVLLGRENYHVVRKRFPPLSKSDLLRAVAHEVRELFPLRDPYPVVYEVTTEEGYSEVLIYAWERDLTETLRREHRANYILPEEILFATEEPTLSIICRESGILLVLSKGGKILGSHLTGAPLCPTELKNFLRWHRMDESQLNRVLLYCRDTDRAEPALSNLRGIIRRRDDYFQDLPSLLKRVPLKDFKVSIKSPILQVRLPFKEAVALTISGLLFYEAYLLFSILEYRDALSHLSRFQAEKISPSPTSTRDDSWAQLLQEELKEHRQHSTGQVLPLLNELTELLPSDSRIIGLQLRPGQLTLNLECGNYSTLIKAFRNSEKFSNLRLLRSPAFLPQSNKYILEIAIRLDTP